MTIPLSNLISILAVHMREVPCLGAIDLMYEIPVPYLVLVFPFKKFWWRMTPSDDCDP